MNRCVFLDRDGIINEALAIEGKPYPPNNVREIKIVDGVDELLKYLKSKGFITVVITNQPDVGNRLQDKKIVEKINSYLMDSLLIDDLFSCYHTAKDKCLCRKPKTKLFELAKEKYNIDFSQSWVIGDRWKDVEAGKNIGAKTIFVDYQYREKQPKEPDFTIKQVSEIIDIFKKELQ